jgi:hypothetical protein
MWGGQFVNRERAQEIEKMLESGAPPQIYEVFFLYVYSDRSRAGEKGQPVVLLPLPDDLCVALYQSNYPFPSSMGRPLRISKDAINAAARPVPRQLPVPQLDPN